jgi:hypothetical protein
VHTLKVIIAGFVLLALCVALGPVLDRANPTAGMVMGAKLFLPLWLIGAGINMWVGVSRAGNSVADEAPVFLVVFAIPAGVAALVWWRLTRAG